MTVICNPTHSENPFVCAIANLAQPDRSFASSPRRPRRRGGIQETRSNEISSVDNPPCLADCDSDCDATVAPPAAPLRALAVEDIVGSLHLKRGVRASILRPSRYWHYALALAPVGLRGVGRAASPSKGRNVDNIHAKWCDAAPSRLSTSRTMEQ